MTRLRYFIVVALATFVPSFPASAEKHWLEVFLDAVGGCANVHIWFLPNSPPLLHRRSDVETGRIDVQLHGKPLLEWSDDDIATVGRLSRDCLVKLNRDPNLARSVEPAHQAIITKARSIDSQRKAQQEARIQLQKAQEQMARERAEEAARREEEHQRQESQRKQEAAEEARRLAEDQFRRRQEQLREQAQLDREIAQKTREREEEHQRQEAQRRKEAAEEARRLAEDQSRRKQEQLREQAQLDREAAQKALELAEREERKIAEVTKEAEAARRARAAAEQRLADIRSRIEAADREKKQALSELQEAEAKRQQEIQREAGSRETPQAPSIVRPPNRATFPYTAGEFAAAFNKAAIESKFDSLRAKKKDCYALKEGDINCTFDVTGVLLLEMPSDKPDGRARKIGLVGAIAKDDPRTALDFMTSCFLVVNLTSPQLSREERSELVLSMIKEASNNDKKIERRVGDVLYSLSVGMFASLSATLQ